MKKSLLRAAARQFKSERDSARSELRAIRLEIAGLRATMRAAAREPAVDSPPSELPVDLVDGVRAWGHDRFAEGVRAGMGAVANVVREAYRSQPDHGHWEQLFNNVEKLETETLKLLERAPGLPAASRETTAILRKAMVDGPDVVDVSSTTLLEPSRLGWRRHSDWLWSHPDGRSIIGYRNTYEDFSRWCGYSQPGGRTQQHSDDYSPDGVASRERWWDFFGPDFLRAFPTIEIALGVGPAAVPPLSVTDVIASFRTLVVEYGAVRYEAGRRSAASSCDCPSANVVPPLHDERELRERLQAMYRAAPLEVRGILPDLHMVDEPPSIHH